MSASGLTWSARLHGWVTDEEAEAEGELAEVERKSDGSNETAVMNGNGGAGKAGAGEEGGEKSGMQGGAPMGRKLTVAEQMEADGVIWAEWDGPEDPANPFNWGVGKKWMTTSIVCFVSDDRWTRTPAGEADFGRLICSSRPRWRTLGRACRWATPR